MLTEGFAKRSGIKVSLRIDPDLGRLCQDVELALFRVIQESLANVLRHSGSPVVDVRIVSTGTTVEAAIVDYGHGILDPLSIERGVGIAGMRGAGRASGRIVARSVQY